MSQFYNDSIFWIEVDKIKPNPYQPRREFDQLQLKSLADSIRQYGVLQALVVTRVEKTKEDGGLVTEYELIAGERRLRASRLAGLTQVPCLIKTGEENAQLKLELAIIENLQREDLNAVDRAKAFKQLADEFGMTHTKIAEKVGRSREYVSNSLRLLNLPQEILDALVAGKISEGHARPLLMLSERPEEQNTVFKEVMYRRLTVRETEQVSRKLAVEKTRKKDGGIDPQLLDYENRLSESFGTRVHIERKEQGGKILIDFFSDEDLSTILEMVKNTQAGDRHSMMNRFIEKKNAGEIPEPEPVVHSADDIEHMVEEVRPVSSSVSTAEVSAVVNAETPVVPSTAAPITPIQPVQPTQQTYVTNNQDRYGTHTEPVSEVQKETENVATATTPVQTDMPVAPSIPAQGVVESQSATSPLPSHVSTPHTPQSVSSVDKVSLAQNQTTPTPTPTPEAKPAPVRDEDDVFSMDKFSI